MWKKDDEQKHTGAPASGGSSSTDAAEREDDRPTRPNAAGVRVTLEWEAHRSVKGKRRVAKLKETLTVPESVAGELRRGRLAAVNDELLPIERRALGGDPDSRVWRRTAG